MKKLTDSQKSDALFALVCFMFVVLMLVARAHALRINPKDLEYIGTLGLGIFGFTVAGIAYSIRVY